jgi:subtilisin family serine protease
MKVQGHDSQGLGTAVRISPVLLAVLAALGLGLGGHACWAGNRPISKGSSAGATWPEADSLDALLEQKLVHPEVILGAFERGQERVRVIVNLIEPTTSLAEEADETTAPEGGGAALQKQGQADPAENGRDTLAAGAGQHGERIRRYHARLARRHAEVQVLQTPVLTALGGKELVLCHRFQNWASFAAEVTYDGLARLAADPLVESIEFDYPMKRLTRQGIPLIRGSEVRSTYGGQGVAIAIVDDGIDYRHPKLGGGAFPNSKVIGGYDIADQDSDPGPDLNLEDCAHGTNCAGIAAGDLAAAGDYIGGVAWAAKLYALKVFSRQRGNIHDSDVIAAWDWCLNHKLDNPAYPLLVISVSLGQDPAWVPADNYTASVRKAADVTRAGITLVAAAGNSGWCEALEWPASLRDVVSVGAVYDAELGAITWAIDGASCAPEKSGSDRRGWSARDVTAPDKVAVYSNVASTLDLFAPSNDTWTTDVVGPPGAPGDYEAGFGGTSASCPYAAGAFACVQSAAYAYGGQYLTPSQVRDVLARTGDPVTDTKTPITKPRINLGQAIVEVLSGRATTVVPVYRFWAPALAHHFYTIDESERNRLLDDYSYVWTYEGTAYHALTDGSEAGSLPVYRFWSKTLSAHFYTVSEQEKNVILATYHRDVWQYEGPVFYAWPEGSQPSDVVPVYRFWSGALKGHFYTISATERDKLINSYAHTWAYEGIAWYARK